MIDDKRRKLIERGAEPLADALLELTFHSDSAAALVDRLIASPKENATRFRRKLAGLKRSNRFIDWKESPGFARTLESILQDLKAGITDPVIGAESVAAFYELDEGVFGRCDDSSGHVADVFRFSAKKLFVEFASRCTEKDRLADIVLKLIRSDGYGIRNTLIDCAAEYLPEPEIRKMIAKLQQLADSENEEYERRRSLGLVASLAGQIKDGELFERTVIASWDKPHAAGIIEIARVYLESGDVEAAQAWLQKVKLDAGFRAYKRDKLLIEVYRRKGNTEELTRMLYGAFRASRSEVTLQALLDVIGEDNRDEVIDSEAKLIHEETVFSELDVEFLISVGRSDEAEEYLLKRSDQLDGNCYTGLLPLAKAFDSEDRNLASTIIYRSLLSSILDRAYTKAYSFGVRYLRKLDRLAESIADWRSYSNHQGFMDELIQKHGRKKSFWSRYEEKK